ncbi:PaaI family thioesterase [Williamsia soli]|uniref:PaaI family thioesterase n=1 Tax=Williamsia soli TaxID=364929 RepID=UPI0027DE3B87|nr:PaaI family thioesterase [Williamsia soli]
MNTPGWDDPFVPSAPVHDEFAELIEALRDVQEAITRSRPDAAVAEAAAESLRAVAARMRDFEVDEDDQISGKRWDLPGSGRALGPPLHLDTASGSSAVGRVTVGRFHSGRYALNGGITPLIFDEIMARLANSSGRRWARTAYLNVNFRAPAPLHTELTVTAELVGQEGRKRLVRGAIHYGDVLVADAEGLWVELKPEQSHNVSNITEVSGR